MLSGIGVNNEIEFRLGRGEGRRKICCLQRPNRKLGKLQK